MVEKGIMHQHLHSLKARLSLSFAVLIFFSMVIGFFSLSKAGDINSNMLVITQQRLPVLDAVKSFNIQFLRVRVHTEKLINAHSESEIIKVSQRLQQATAALDIVRNDIESQVTDEDELATYAQLKDAEARYWALQQDIANKAKYNEAVSQQESDNLDTFTDEVTEQLNKLIHFETSLIEQAKTEAASSYRSAKNIILLTLATVAILAFIIALKITVDFSRSIKMALREVRAIASGDLTRTIDTSGKDEITILMADLKVMQQNIKNMIDKISRSSELLASTSTELSHVTDDASRTLIQQSNELEQTATAVTEMSVSIENVAKNATDTYSASVEMIEKTSYGREQVALTVTAVTTLSRTLDDALENVKHLASRASNIESVLSVIEKVAEQTNLLALNAAIEAARAGEAGRGFAVVADEVSALSRRTQESTQKIEEMISAIQLEMEQTVRAMDKSKTQSKSALDIAKTADHALVDIYNSTSQINEWNSNIASSAEQQSQVTKEVDERILSIRDLSTQTSAGSAQITTSTQQLTELAIELSTLIREFKLQ